MDAPTMNWEEFCTSCDATRAELDVRDVIETVGPVNFVIVESDDEVWVNRSQGGRRDEKLPVGLATLVVKVLRRGFSLRRRAKNGPTVMWKNRSA